MQHKFDNHDVNISSGGKYYNSKNNSFKRNTNRVNNNDYTSSKAIEKFDNKTNDRILNNNLLISQIMDDAKDSLNKVDPEISESKTFAQAFSPFLISSLNRCKNSEDPNTPRSIITSKVKESNFRQNIIKRNISPILQKISRKELSPLEKKDLLSPRGKQNFNQIDHVEIEKSVTQKNKFRRNSIKKTYQIMIAQNIMELEKYKKSQISKIKTDPTHLLDSKKYESWLLDTNQYLEIEPICAVKSENILLKDDNKNISSNENILSNQSLDSINVARLTSNDIKNTQERIKNKQSLLNLKRLKDIVENGMDSPSRSILNFATQRSSSKINKTNLTLANSFLKSNNDDLRCIDKFGKMKSLNKQISSASTSPLKNNLCIENRTILNFHDGIVTNLNQEANKTVSNLTVNALNNNHKTGNILFQNLLVPKINRENDISKIKILDYLIRSKEYMNIKKEIPSFLSDNPASRQEVIILCNWLDSRVKEILQDPNLSIQAKNDKIDEINNLCLNEMLRQISMDCNERGRLLSTLWTSYLEQFDQFRTLIQEEKRNLIIESENSYNRVHKMYKDKMQNQNQLISELKNEIKTLLTSNKHLDLDYKMVLKFNEQNTQKNIEYKKLLGSCRKQVLALKKENEICLARLGPTSNSSLKLISNDIPQDEEEEGSDTLSNVSSEFVFENQLNGKSETMKIKSLNLITHNIDLKMKYCDVEIQTCFNEDYIVNSSKETQTNFNFIDKKYNLILRNQKVIDEILLEHKFKYELDMVSEAKLIYIKQTEGENASKRLYRKKFQPQGESKEIDFSGYDLSKIRKRKNSCDGIPKIIDNKKYKMLIHSKNNFKTEISHQIFSLLGEDFQRIAKSPSNFVRNSSRLLSKTNPNKKMMTNTLTQEDDMMNENFYEVAKFEILEDKDASSSSDSESNSKIKPNIQRIKIGSIPSDIDAKLNQIYRSSRRHLKSSPKIKRSIRISIIPEEQESDDECPNFIVKFLAFSNKSQKIGLKLIDSIVNNKNEIDQKKALIRIIRLYKIESEKNRVYELIILDLHHNNCDLQKNIIKLNEEIKLSKVFGKKGTYFNDNPEIRNNINDEEICTSCGRKYNDELDKEFSSLQNELKNINFDIMGDKQISNRKNSKRMKLIKSKTTMFLPNNFSKKENNNIENSILEQNANMGMVIINKLKSLRITTFNNYMSLKQVLKMITQVYEERLIKNQEIPTINEEELGNFTFKIFQSNMKGAKNIALQKFVIFLLSLKKYLNTVRVNLFTKFLGLNESFQYNLDEFNRYIDILQFIQKSKLGAAIVNGESDTRHFVTFLRVLDYAKLFSENKFGFEEYDQFKKELESLKEYNPKNIEDYDLIDIDLFSIKILTKYREVCNYTKQYVINAFKAADLDSDHTCSFKEFNLLYKYIEFEKYDEEFVKFIFEQNADVTNEAEKALSFDKFTIICVEYGLFSDAKQDLFLKLKGDIEFKEEFMKLRHQWENYSNDLKVKIQTLKNDNRKYWNQILDVLNERIKNEINYKPFLIAYYVLNKEIKYLQENEVLKKLLY